MTSSSSLSARTVLDADAMARTLSRLAHELIERNDDLDVLVLVGIRTRGVPLARRLRDLVAERSGIVVDTGVVDIAFHRDDLWLREGDAPESWRRDQPVVHGSVLDVPLDGRTVVLVDDVLYTGRTIRAAIDALLEYGRPARIQLAALVDRGHRELPIRPDYVGKNIPTARGDHVQVMVSEVDGADRVTLTSAAEAEQAPGQEGADG